MIQDMTTGNPLKLIVKFALPILLGNVVQQLYQISDMIIVGRLLGVNSLAAIGASAPIYFVVLLVVFGFTGGLTMVTAQRFGAKDYAGVRRSVTHSLTISLFLSVLITICCLCFLNDILTIMNVPNEIWQEAYEFTFFLLSGLFLVVGYNLLAGIIRALGDSKTPLYFLIISAILNVFFNFIFIYNFSLGVVGSALGTLLAIFISAIACVWYIGKKFEILRLKYQDWILSWSFIKEHLRIAVPLSFQFSIIAFSLMIMQSVCNTFGPTAIAAFSAALRVEQLATQPLLAIGLAVATYSAQNYGAGLIGRIRRGVQGASILSLSLSLFIALSVRIIGQNMIGIFIENPSQDIILTGVTYLSISTIFYFFLGQIFVFRNSLQGMGKLFVPVMASLVELFMRSFAAIYLAKQVGFLGVCWAGPIAWFGGSLVVLVGYVWVMRKFVRSFRLCYNVRF